MASGILSSITRMTDKLAAPIRRSLGGSSSSDPHSVEEDLNKLKSTLETIEAVLYDAEKREIREESVKLWLSELKAVACDSEDVLDEFEYELLRSKLESRAPMKFPGKRKQGEIRERFDEIAAERVALQLREGDGPLRVVDNYKQPPSSSNLSQLEIHGREEDCIKLIKLLLSEDFKGSNISVLPIVGMPGVGKTTLAQLVFNDSRVCKHFNTREWISLYGSFNVARLMKEIIESITKSPSDLTEVSALQECLKEVLSAKRFLLVLDDVWNEDQMLWEMLRSALASDVEGSKIIVTTRNETVARIVQTMPLYQLDCLSDEDCWRLFRRWAFDGRDPRAHPELVEIGKMIASKCGGLPLAAKALGGLLRFENDEEKWVDLLQSDLWDLEDTENKILPALKLSYQHLPVHLKRCFVYCSVFPKGFVFKKHVLVRLWMVQGFLQTRDDKEPEDMGFECFDDLLGRSFFQHWKLEFGDEEKFVMHDLFLDLCRYISGEECLLTENSDLRSLSPEARHLSLIPYGSRVTMQLNSIDKPRPLRSLLLIYRLIYSWGGVGLWEGNLVHLKIPDDIFLNLPCLRSLDLAYTDIEELPNSIGSLKHLRYLSLRSTKIRKLPESLCRLYYLQTLEMAYCNNLRELPKGIGNLANLRHLELPTMEDSYVCMPSGIGRLTGLQELAAFNVGGDGRHCGIGELKDMANLGGDLHISGLRNVARGWDAKEANLMNKKNLQRLTLDWYVHQSDYKCSHLNLSSDDERTAAKLGANCSSESGGVLAVPWEHFQEEDVVFESLQPHPNLVVLQIRNYNGARFPKWLGDPSLSNLVTIKLFICEKCEALPSFGELSSLRNLHIAGMGSIRRIEQEFCGTKQFPALEELQFEWMPEWEAWSGVKEGAFPQLAELIFRDCPKLGIIPKDLAPSLKKLDVGDCKQLSILPAPPSLTSLCIGGESMEQLWSYTTELTKLEALEVAYCEGLTCLPLHNMPALKRLEITDCSQLATIDCRGGSAAAKALASSSSSVPSQVGLHNLISLENLKIENCPVLQFAMEEQLPPMLKDVVISCCPFLVEWCERSEGRSQLARVPNFLVENYDADEFQEWVMSTQNEESDKEIEED
ncbi:putative disease resistance protein RGA3 isoform X2 [Phoenix dactylifera]|uniref:Disease resistance protein RGA3 isoform X2 n=1 Tax=Phoenix dactylifera TaxID=42345 RepID=A0A8B8ZPF1_PHODC|nr:putative disease resistance protein RGA3 isoform X2 [Phoenix dactylifera]